MTDGAVGWPEWLKQALADRGWKAADLARASGVKDNGRPVIAPDVISGWLNQGAKPSAQFWPLLAQIFGVEVNDLALLVSGERLAVAPTAPKVETRTYAQGLKRTVLAKVGEIEPDDDTLALLDALLDKRLDQIRRRERKTSNG